MVDLINHLAKDWQVMDPADERYIGLPTRCRSSRRPTSMTLLAGALTLSGWHGDVEGGHRCRAR
jgi:hypothetical protein